MATTRRKKAVRTTKKTDTETMFNKRKIGKYIVRPWSLEKIMDMAPLVIQAQEKLSAKGIKVDDGNMMKLVALSLPVIKDEIFEIIARTLEISADEVRSIEPASDQIAIVYTIAIQNIGYLKNSYGLITEMLNPANG